jgi:hypothetical protein
MGQAGIPSQNHEPYERKYAMLAKLQKVCYYYVIAFDEMLGPHSKKSAPVTIYAYAYGAFTEYLLFFINCIQLQIYY